ncbi:MAG: 50S ribosomal protein L5 [Candidatus Niyogibacteria bacterium]|nr:50S ribosomal protein L5 [Candidatus Niyogibacteria bacterium]
MIFKSKNRKQIISEMKEKFGYENELAVPRLVKAAVNIGIGRYEDKQKEEIRKQLEAIIGQRAVAKGAKQAIASFKTRKGMPVGYAATLRGKRMADFFEKTINFTIPRMRDFRGIDQKSVDQGGNLTIGIRENILFPEMIGEDVKNIFGLEITFVTNAKSREEALEFFKVMGVPFVNPVKFREVYPNRAKDLTGVKK